MLVRGRKIPRRGVFDPTACSDPTPIPAGSVDVRRATRTNLETEGEKSINDIWDGTVGKRRTLFDWWVGEVRLLSLWHLQASMRSMGG